jgi:hypothetical protein
VQLRRRQLEGAITEAFDVDGKARALAGPMA